MPFGSYLDGRGALFGSIWTNTSPLGALDKSVYLRSTDSVAISGTITIVLKEGR